MNGKTLSEFIDDLYYNPETEMEYHNICYSVSGYIDSNKEHVLQVDSIESKSTEVFFVKRKNAGECVKAFEEAKIFDGKTIYEAESEITVLYG